MDTADLNRLREIAAKPEETTTEGAYAPLSDARMAAVAQAIIKHAERFDLDGAGEHGGLPMDSYIASFLTDVLHFADMVIPVNVETVDGVTRVFSPGGAKACLEHAISYASDSETETYENLKGLTVR